MNDSDKREWESADTWVYRYVWGNTVERRRMKGRKCRVLSRGAVYVIQFLDNDEKTTCPMRALRRVYAKPGVKGRF